MPQPRPLTLDEVHDVFRHARIVGITRPHYAPVRLPEKCSPACQGPNKQEAPRTAIPRASTDSTTWGNREHRGCNHKRKS